MRSAELEILRHISRSLSRNNVVCVLSPNRHLYKGKSGLNVSFSSDSSLRTSEHHITSSLYKTYPRVLYFTTIRHIYTSSITPHTSAVTNMHFSKLSIMFNVAVLSFAIASPIELRDIASCETQTAANEVACIQGCNKDAACITSW